MAIQKEAVVTHAASTGTVATRRLGLLSIVLLGLTVVLGLFVSDEDVIQGSTVRIMYVHVPTIWVAYMAFAFTAVCSAIYLTGKNRSLAWDRVSGASAEIGVLFVAISFIWSKEKWAVFLFAGILICHFALDLYVGAFQFWKLSLLIPALLFFRWTKS